MKAKLSSVPVVSPSRRGGISGFLMSERFVKAVKWEQSSQWSCSEATSEVRQSRSEVLLRRSCGSFRKRKPRKYKTKV